MSGNMQVADNTSLDKPGLSEIWKILKAIQVVVAKILYENQELRKDIDGLRANFW